MKEKNVCIQCGVECDMHCAAIEELEEIYYRLRDEEKTEVIKQLRQDLNMNDAEVADDLRELAEKVIEKIPALSIIPNFDIKVGYVRSYEQKLNKGKTVFGDCRKVTGVYKAYLPFDFIITFYEPNMYYMSENQQKLLMLHELMHIGIGERGLRLEPHDIEEFTAILKTFGDDWEALGKDVPDIIR